MTAHETLEQFKRQAEIELDAAQRRVSRALSEVKALNAEVYKLRGTLNEVTRASNAYADEMSEKLRAATDSECKQKALYCKARDELELTARGLQVIAARLELPEKVLEEHAYPVNEENPLHTIRFARKYLSEKVKALKKLKGENG